MNRLIARAVFALVVAAALSARAQVQLYSFEDGTQGFGPNGFPAPTVAQDTIGATHGTRSLLFGLGANQTFSGALTETVNQAALLDPSTTAVAVDVTVPQGDGQYTGTGFANMGITLFGSNPSQGVFGVPVQTNGASERTVDLAPGTHTLVIPLVTTTGPMRDAWGPGGPFTNVGGLQFYINKSADDALVVYLDNVRAVPEPASAALTCAALFGLVARRRRGAATAQ